MVIAHFMPHTALKGLTPVEKLLKYLAQKALEKKIKNFTGVDDPYEEPEAPELILYSDKETVGESVQKVLDKLEELEYVKM